MAELLDNAVNALNQDYLRRYPAEAAHAAGQMAPEEVARLLGSLPAPRAIELWEHLPTDAAADALGDLEAVTVRTLLERADAVKGARALARLAAPQRARAVALLEPGRARELETLMQYPERSAGALMDVDFPRLHAEMSVREALHQLRRRHTRPPQQLYLVAGDTAELRRVPLHELALADPHAPLLEISQPAPVTVLPTAGIEEIVEAFDTHRIPGLPVVDVHGELVGVLRQEALVEAVRTDTSSDILSMVGASKEERALSNIGFVVRKRLPWLHINLVTAFLAASVVGLFEATIAQFTALAVLLPVVAGQSGNTGAQALAVTMRALALREISISHWWRVARKEAGAGFINGVVVSLVTAIGVLVWSGSYGLALVIGSAMVISMVAAGVSGVIIPIALQALGQDPAQSSSIILTTITDVVGFFTFLGIATALSTLL